MTARRSKLRYEPVGLEGAGLMFGLLLMAFGSSSLGHSQEIAASTLVRHQPASCMDTETFPLIEAWTLSPDAARDVRGLSVRFRAEDAPDWHEIAMESESDTRFSAALLRPRPEAVRVRYYFAWGRPEVRSPEFVVNILMGGSSEDATSANPGDVTFTSQLDLPEGNSGQISLNATEIVATAAPSPQRYRLRAHAQENVVDALLLTRPNGPGQWQFDFSNSQGFVPGSLRVDSGQVLGLDSRRVVFRVGEGVGPSIRSFPPGKLTPASSWCRGAELFPNIEPGSTARAYSWKRQLSPLGLVTVRCIHCTPTRSGQRGFPPRDTWLFSSTCSPPST